MGHEAGSDVAYRFESFCLDTGSRILTKKGEKVHLATKPMGVLRLLVESAGKLVTSGDFYKQLWGITKVKALDNNLNKQISVLRKALGEGPKDNRYIETFPHQGYRFAAPVKIIRMEPPRHKCGFMDMESGELVEVVPGDDGMPEAYTSPGDVGMPEGYTSPGDRDLSNEEIMEPNNQGFEEQRTATVDGRTQKKRRHSPSRRTKPQLPPARPKKKGRHSLSPRTKSQPPPARPTHRSRHRDR
jgi:DNA-binding winged helix-turn-helix (wHTH) protein